MHATASASAALFKASICRLGFPNEASGLCARIADQPECLRNG